jgi:ABC-type glycerol-3-phosphate transport system substrate-binding protein
MTKTRVSLLAFAVLLAACGGAGSGGTTPTSTVPATNAPTVAGTEEPKQYNPGKTPSPSASDYYGY